MGEASGGDTPRRADDDPESTLASTAESLEAPPPEKHYLLIFEASSSTLFPLPPSGEVVIGRGDAADLKLHDTSVSRRHARIVCTPDEAHLSDLGSQNGTFVNGERLAASRVLLSSDTVTICGATLVFHSRGHAPSERPLLKFEQLRDRIEEEIERSLRYRRPFALAAALFPAGADRARAAHALGRALRGIDVAAPAGGEQLLVLLPETDPDAAPEAVSRIGAALSAVSPQMRVGYATCPGDGSDLATLLAAARSAAQTASAGSYADARAAFQTRTIGEQSIVIADPAMVWLYALIERLAAADLPVLVCGETGTGKELAASAVHHWSARKGPLVALNCAALQESLVESELFGHEKGAFTGAHSSKPGLLEAARGGTVFLDEIGETSPGTQAKLLRVLETKRVTRVGDVREREIDIRLVAASNRNLAEEAKTGRFRQDLFFRLSAATVWIPPLRDRKREIAILANRFLADACARAGRAPMSISDEAMHRLSTHAWPGNVRELKNVMEYVAAAFKDATLEAWHLAASLGGQMEEEEAAAAGPEPTPPPAPASPEWSGEVKFRSLDEELRELERTRMLQALNAANGNQTHAAALIGMPLRTFQAKVKYYDLPRPGPKRR